MASLARYQQKRDFKKTPEPAGQTVQRRGALRFVIQRHEATRLHYDFRLELDGVLKSWAVPKGPSLDPTDKRLAVHVEDHPVAYGTFEGVIPEGEYGGGSVVLWDRGRWFPEGDADAGYRKGHLRFRLEGEKCKGGYSLVRMHGRRGGDEKHDNWLLIKTEDEESSADGEALVRDRPESVETGRVNAEVAEQADQTWTRKGAVRTGTAKKALKKTGTGAAKKSAKSTTGTARKRVAKAATGAAKKAAKVEAGAKKIARSGAAKKAAKSTTGTAKKRVAKAATGASRKAAKSTARGKKKAGGAGAEEPAPAVRGRAAPARLGSASVPESLVPELATLVEHVPTGDAWLHEVKFDGYRLIARLSGGVCTLTTRNGLDWTARFHWLARALQERLGDDQVLLDGELVHLGDDGVSRFGALQQALADERDAGLVYFVFDLLHLRGLDLRPVPLEQRKQALAELLPPERKPGRVRLSEHILGQGAPLFTRACGIGLEGVISKRRDAPYRAGRHRDWLKTKCGRRQEVVIGGFTGARSGTRDIGALLVGVYDDEGVFHYGGKVGSGFDQRSAAAMRERLLKMTVPRRAFAELPPESGRATYVRPEVVVEVSFTDWTEDGRMRHPVFVGVREDKRPRDVRRERATPVAQIEAAQPGPPQKAGEAMATRSAREAAATAATAKKKKKATAKRGAPAGATASRSATKAAKKSGAAGRSTTKAAKKSGAAGRSATKATTKSAGRERSVATGAAKPATKKSGARRVASEIEVMGVRISHPDRALYPADGISKHAVAEYYAAVAEWMLPWVEGRPVSVVRCPDNIDKPCFFQKHLHHDAPAGVGLAELDEGAQPFIFVENDARGLVGLAQSGVIELHVWGSTARRPEAPDRVVFDLDPHEAVPWARVKETASALRERLEALELASFLKTTGGKGLHVVVPLAPGKQDWAQVKGFSRAVAVEFVRAAPELFIATAGKADRKGKIFLDYLRNGRGATSVAPYSLRTRRGAPASVPIRWDELARLQSSAKYTLENLAARLKRLGAPEADPWAEMLRPARQSLRPEVLRAVGYVR